MRIGNSICCAGVLLLAAASVGCRGYVDTYDLSRVRPFSSYSGREVALTRDVLLLQWPDPENAAADYRLVYRGPQVERARAAGEMVTRATLPAGTHVIVLKTYVLHICSPFPQLQQVWNVCTKLRVSVSISAAPQYVTAIFDPSYGEDIAVLPKPFEGAICPAPWEPTDTSARRVIGWPSDKDLVKSEGFATGSKHPVGE